MRNDVSGGPKYIYIDIQIHFDNHNMNTIINKYLLAAQYNEEQCQKISQIQIDNHNMNTMINIYMISAQYGWPNYIIIIQ